MLKDRKVARGNTCGTLLASKSVTVVSGKYLRTNS
jgi:hypothetical protein